MKSGLRIISIIGINTFREIIRDRILYGILVFAVILIGLSIALGELSFAEQARISADFGFAGIQLSAVILSIFAGSTLVAREIEKQTILTLLVRPVSRTQFLFGKFLGLASVVTVVVAGLAATLAGLLIYLELGLHLSFLWALLGILIESLILTAMALFFGSFAKPMMTVVFTVSVFLIGHWVSSLDFFVKKSQSESFIVVGKILSATLPDLERFNWRSAPVYDTFVSISDVGITVAYGIGWIALLMIFMALIFGRRDFV